MASGRVKASYGFRLQAEVEASGRLEARDSPGAGEVAGGAAVEHRLFQAGDEESLHQVIAAGAVGESEWQGVEWQGVGYGFLIEEIAGDGEGKMGNDQMKKCRAAARARQTDEMIGIGFAMVETVGNNYRA